MALSKVMQELADIRQQVVDPAIASKDEDRIRRAVELWKTAAEAAESESRG